VATKTRLLPRPLMWWDKYLKKAIRRFFIHGRQERAREERDREDYYYSCLYDLLQKPMDYPNLHSRIRHFQAKIIRLHEVRTKKLQVDVSNPAPFSEERLSMYHLLSVRKHRQRRLIKAIMDSTGHMHTTAGAIRKRFARNCKLRIIDLQCNRAVPRNYTQPFNTRSPKIYGTCLMHP
jgi:hypothetical protein